VTQGTALLLRLGYDYGTCIVAPMRQGPTYLGNRMKSKGPTRHKALASSVQPESHGVDVLRELRATSGKSERKLREEMGARHNQAQLLTGR